MTDSYITPDWLRSLFYGWFDPCPINENPKINGLFIDWKDRTFVNPPFSNIEKWIIKAINENKKGYRIAILLPVWNSINNLELLKYTKHYVLLIDSYFNFKNIENEVLKDRKDWLCMVVILD